MLALLDRDAQTLAEMVEWKQVEKERARILAERDFRDPRQLASELQE